MKRNYVTVLAIAFSFLVPISSYAGTWQHTSEGWKYLNDDATNIVNQWVMADDGSWYNFDENGIMRTGWFKDVAGKWYHFNSSGSMTKGWYEDFDSKWYYFGENGEMYSSTTTPDGYWVDENGLYTSKNSVLSATAKAASYDADLANKVIDIVNNERAARSLQKVEYNSYLTEAARLRAKEIVESFSHTRPNGSSFSTSISSDYKYYSVGENVANGQTSAASVMTDWMNSQGHKENILNPKYNEIGVAAYNYGGRLYWVQLFGEGKSSQASKYIADGFSREVANAELSAINTARLTGGHAALEISSNLNSAADLLAEEDLTKQDASRYGGKSWYSYASDKVNLSGSATKYNISSANHVDGQGGVVESVLENIPQNAKKIGAGVYAAGDKIMRVFIWQ